MSEYAVQIMFGYLFLGLGFLLIKQPRLMFASYIACSILAIHLKLNTNPDLKSPEATEDQAVIDIAVMDISNITQEPNETLDAIFESDACLLSLPNIDLDIYEFIRDTLREKYPYATERVGFEPGIALFSKYKISRKDTFFVDGLPNIVGSIRAEGRGQELYFITSNTLPPFYTRDYDRTKRQLNRIADIVNTIGAPILTFADYNLVPWSDEIHDFRDKAHLKDSRRGFTPASSTSLIGSFFDSPRDHIFFSEHFKCIGFENLKSSTYKHLGIKGSFQFNPTVVQ
ncbi:MAG: hypothetical protein AAF573_07640 [Bacteroidota bacterium]